MKRLLFFLLMLWAMFPAVSQQPDSIALPAADSTVTYDTVSLKDTSQIFFSADSVSKRPLLNDSAWMMKTSLQNGPSVITHQILEHHPWFGFSSAPLQQTQEVRKHQYSGKELLFYLILVLLIIYGFLRMLFPKYFNDLFRLFFRTTIKQRQIKEQLMQTPLPSLLLNAFFVISAGLYIAFLLQHFELNTIGNFWLLLLYCCGGLSVVYFIKFAGLKIAGWLFNMEEAADSYIFIVFVVNKMMGLLLLPFLVLIAFTIGEVYSAGLVLSWCLVGGLMIYRFILTYSAVRNQVKVNPFHFFLYLCAFEVAPLLLIYKGLLLFFHITA